MTKIILSITVALAAVANLAAQSSVDSTALKGVVDAFTALADKKDVNSQVMLFTDDAEVITLDNGALVSAYKGRAEIGKALTDYLSRFGHVRHVNGQQTVKIDGDNATGTSFSQVYGKVNQQGKYVEIVDGAYYADEYVKLYGHWFIKKRTVNLMRQNVVEIPIKAFYAERQHPYAAMFDGSFGEQTAESR